MTHLFDDPTKFAATALAGFCDVYSRLVQPVRGGVVRSTATPEGKVAVVSGGGSGHYPAFAGYVGPGLCDAAVAGDVFASPSARAVYEVCKHAHRGGGVWLSFGNYAGDVLNFGIAGERLRAEGIDVRILPVTDDVASASEHHKRRGVAGDLMVFKIAGAAAEAGKDLDEVERLAKLANDRTRSFGVAFGGCTLPGADEPLFTVPEGKMAIGLGIHGEPGIEEVDMPSAAALAEILTARLLKEAPEKGGTRVAAVVNGLGATKYEELFVLWTEVARRLRAAGLELVAPEVGELVTSLDMEGCSLTLTWLDEELEELWLAPCETAVMRRGATTATTEAPRILAAEAEAVIWPEADEAGRAAAKAIAGGLAAVNAMLHEHEEELGRIDARAGDGDHGRGMSRGAEAAAEVAQEAVAGGAGARSALQAAADAWQDRAGGTSGALWGLGLHSAGSVLSDTGAATAQQAGDAVRAAMDAVMRLGKAKPGDKTLIDAFVPFTGTLEAALGRGASLAEAWGEAAQAAQAAADKTRDLLPRLGRARPLAERSKGHPDAGAISLALIARVVLGQIQKK